MKKHSIEELNRLYDDADSVDQEIFAEQRSNVLLYAGDHYNKRGSTFYKRIRDSKELTNEQKIRLTKNHTQYVCDIYSNNIVAPNPGVGFSPKNEKEIHDQKVADMHHAVWRDGYDKYNIEDRIDDWADSYVQIGEVAVKLFYDPSRGQVKAYEQKVNDEGVPLFIAPDGTETVDDGSLMGAQFSPAPDKEKPIRKGEFVFKEIYGFNLLRPADCKDMKDAEWLGERYMSDKDALLAKFPDKEEFIKPGTDETYMIFDTSRGGYTTAQKQIPVREYYFKPCAQYENGYFYITTKEGILAEGELPGGEFPIEVRQFRRLPTSPRGRGPIKTMRPYQAEINRAGSKMAEHQITLGDDKIILQNGTKVSAGMSLPGVRTVSVTGQNPVIMQGRDGSQYLNYMNSQIAEMYQVLGLKEVMADMPAQVDSYMMLYASARSKKVFQRYIKGFEKFLIGVVKKYLKLAKIHLPDDELIYAIGSMERVNIPEYRELDDICYEIKIEAQAEDIETKLGKTQEIMQILQYSGSVLSREDIGKLIRQLPYSNYDESFSDLTLNYDLATNDILALDRGEMPPINKYDDHPYMISKLTFRSRQPDFKYLSPQIQGNYEMKIKKHEEIEAQKQMAIQRAQQGLIPTGGYLVVCDLYVPDPSNPTKTQRVRLPSEAIQWLISQTQAQQQGLAPLAELPTGAKADIAEQFLQQRSPQVAQ
jgi:hypothetical protein